MEVNVRYIYRIKFPNGKFYIGQTKNIEERMRAYKRLHCKDMPRLYYALKKYDFQNCEVDILEESNEKNIDLLEQKYIKLYNTTNINFGYNLDSGGCENKSHSKETILKIINSKKGKSLSVEHKKNLSESHKGQIAWNKGKTGIYSEETLLKMSENRKGKGFHTKSDEVKAKIGKANSIKLKGKKQSDETKAKKSRAMKLYWKIKKNT